MLRDYHLNNHFINVLIVINGENMLLKDDFLSIARLQETELVRERLNDQHLALEKSLRMEQEQRQQLEETLNTMQEQARLTAENREVSRHVQRCGLCAVQVLMNFYS